MSEPLVLALVAADVPEAAVGALRAGFEEEGVPLTVERAEGTRQDTRPRSGVACAARHRGGPRYRGGVRVLAGAPSVAYLQAEEADVRALAHDAARVAGRRPLRRPAT